MRLFYAALYNTLRGASYAAPSITEPPVHEYMILNRPTNEILTISDAGAAPAKKPKDAPRELRERNTIVGTLISQNSDSGEENFIFNRYIPDNMTIRGRFFPAEGMAILKYSGGRPQLKATGRSSHLRIVDRGRVLLVDAAGDATKNPDARTWHFDATPLRWSEEILR